MNDAWMLIRSDKYIRLHNRENLDHNKILNNIPKV